MDEKIKDLLEEEIKVQIKDLAALEAGSKEKSTAIDDLAKLYKMRIEEVKAKLDFGEGQLKRSQLAEQTKDRYFRLGLEAAGIILPLVFYAVWMRRGFKFEETGTYTSTTFKGLFNRFRPTK